MRCRRGFTLIELMIAAAIIAVLSMIALPKFADMIIKAKEAAVIGKLGALRGAFRLYYTDTEGATPFLQGTSAGLALGRYIDAIPAISFPRHHGDPVNPTPSGALPPSFATSYPHDVASRNFALENSQDPCEGCAVTVTQARYMFDNFPGYERIYLNCQHMNSRGISWTNY